VLVEPGRLALVLRNDAGIMKVSADFVSGSTAAVGKPGENLRQPLAKAVGVTGRHTPRVLDATAGLGGDAFRLAGWGCSVRALERSPIVFSLLQDGLARAAQAAARLLRETAARIEPICADTRTYLAELPDADRPEVVYVDPMYPERRKATGAVRKEMALLRRLVGDDPDAAALLDISKRIARDRVVVKRHKQVDPLEPDPDVTYQGKIGRYDVYWSADRGGRA
jgi:16S rRNA (guanine1516-N2)-methyltransferase